MKRMRGFEILVLACNRHFAILEWTPTGFVQLASLRNIHENPICDFVLRGKFLYSKALSEQHVKITELGVDPMDSILVDSPYSDFQILKIFDQALVGLEKVTLNLDGSLLYTGGRGLHLFQRQGAAFKSLDLDINRETEFFGIKSNPLNDDILIHEPSTNNLVHLTSRLEYVKKYNGVQKCVFPQTHLRNPHFTGDDSTMIWF